MCKDMATQKFIIHGVFAALARDEGIIELNSHVSTLFALDWITKTITDISTLCEHCISATCSRDGTASSGRCE